MLFTNIQAQSDDVFERAQVLDNPRYPLQKRFMGDLGISWLPQDSFYKPIFVEATGTYSWSDFWGVEARAGYILTANGTGLQAQLEKETGQKVETEGVLYKDAQMKLGASALMHFFYSKSNFFNRAIVYHFWSLGLGPAFLKTEKKSQFGAEASLLVRVVLWERSMLNLRFAYMRGFQSGLAKDVISVGMGAGWLF